MSFSPGSLAGGLAVAGLLLGAVIANVAQLPSLENQDRLSYRAIVRSETASMAALGLESSPTARERRGLYLWLSEVAPSVDLLVGPDSELAEWQLYGLAEVDRVVHTASDDDRLADVDVSDHVVADDDDGRYGPVPFTIAIADDAATTLVVRVSDDRHDLIDVRLLPDELREDLLR